MANCRAALTSICLLVLFQQGFALAQSQPATTTASASSPGFHLPSGSRANALFIDNDGDGYGVACPNGADADDADSTINTSQSMLARYSELRAFLLAKGYKPRRLFFIAPGGDDRKGVSDHEEMPFATFAVVKRLMRPGDAVIWRQGVYDDSLAGEFPPINGTQSDPFLFMAYPGEQAVIRNPSDAVRLANSSYVIIDGLTLDSPKTDTGHGVSMLSSHHITLRNLDSRHHARGIIGMQNIKQLIIENCVLRENNPEHGIYLGCRDQANQDITIRGCVVYKNLGHGIQHNGRVTNLRIEDNLVHTNSTAGISLIQGVSDSVVRNNLIFNNNKQGIVFYYYDSDYASIGSYDQSRNAIEGNTIWVGRFSWDGEQEPKDYAAVLFSDDTKARQANMTGNAFRNNILVTDNGPAFWFKVRKFADGSTVQNNLIHRAKGPMEAIKCEERLLAFPEMSVEWPAWAGNRFGDPRFPSVSITYYSRPEKFRFVE